MLSNVQLARFFLPANLRRPPNGIQAFPRRCPSTQHCVPACQARLQCVGPFSQQAYYGPAPPHRQVVPCDSLQSALQTTQNSAEFFHCRDLLSTATVGTCPCAEQTGCFSVPVSHAKRSPAVQSTTRRGRRARYIRLWQPAAYLAYRASSCKALQSRPQSHVPLHSRVAGFAEESPPQIGPLGVLAGQFANLFPLWLVTVGGLSIVHPPAMLWFRSELVTAGLALTMTTMGSTLTVEVEARAGLSSSA